MYISASPTVVGFPSGEFMGIIIVECLEGTETGNYTILAERPIPGWARNNDRVEFVYTSPYTGRIIRRGLPICPKPIFEISFTKDNKPKPKPKPKKVKKGQVKSSATKKAIAKKKGKK